MNLIYIIQKDDFTDFIDLTDFTDVDWCEIPEGCCKALQCVQNRAARFILRIQTSKDSTLFACLTGYV